MYYWLWAPAGMGKREYLPPPLPKCCKAFLCISSYSKTLSRRMHYFHNLLSASGGFAPRPPPGLHPWTPLGDFRPQTPNLPTHGKNPVDAHATGGVLQHVKCTPRKFYGCFSGGGSLTSITPSLPLPTGPHYKNSKLTSYSPSLSLSHTLACILR